MNFPGSFRIDQHHWQFVLHQVVERLTVITGRFPHDDGGDLLGLEVISQLKDLVGGCTEGSDVRRE